MIVSLDRYPPVSIDLLRQFNDFLAQYIGISFKEKQLGDLENGVRRAMTLLGARDIATCINQLMSKPLSRQQIEVLSIHLTIGETYFFREYKTFEILEQRILPGFIQEANGKPRSLRIWSAACSTGEEAYSIAIVLDRLKHDLKDWTITLLATDINLDALEKARTGIYNEWSFRNCPPWLKPTYFIQHNERQFGIKPHIKQMVRFNYLNLAENVYPSLLNQTNATDIIFCRNVLMYFLPDKANAVVERLYRSLVSGGWLIVSPTDAFHVINVHCFHPDSEYTSIFRRCEPTPPAATSKYFSFQSSPMFPFPSTPVPRAQEIGVGRGIATFLNINQEKKEVKKPGEPVDPFTQAWQEANGLYHTGDYQTALIRLQALATDLVSSTMADHKQAGIHTLITRCYANLGQLDKAANQCQLAIQSDKLNPHVHYLQSLIFQEMGNNPAAVRALKKCLYLDPGFLMAHFNLGILFSANQEHHTALKHLNTALSLLQSRNDEEIVSVEEGLTVGRLRQILRSTIDAKGGDG